MLFHRTTLCLAIHLQPDLVIALNLSGNQLTGAFCPPLRSPDKRDLVLISEMICRAGNQTVPRSIWSEEGECCYRVVSGSQKSRLAISFEIAYSSVFLPQSK